MMMIIRMDFLMMLSTYNNLRRIYNPYAEQVDRCVQKADR